MGKDCWRRFKILGLRLNALSLLRHSHASIHSPDNQFLPLSAMLERWKSNIPCLANS